MRATLIATLALALLVGLTTTTASGTEGTKLQRPATGQLGVIATESPAAARVGRAVLERGGNAVDAAAATVFAIGVARPQSCGIGGGGFMVYRSARGKTDTLDFRETAPAAFRPRTLKRKGLHTDFTGHLTVGVPGTVAGMQAMLKRYGSDSLAQAVRPAERLARRGVRVTPGLAGATKENVKRMRLFPATRRQYLRRGKPLRAGSRLRQPAMAATLRRIIRRGPRGFYRGINARRIVADMRRASRRKGDRGILRLRDLARYKARWRSALQGSFRGRQIVAMPPPTSGGIALLQMLNVLEGYDLKASGQSSADSLHPIIEAEKQAFADRGEYVGDPGFVNVPTRRLISKAYAARRRALIRPDRAGTYEPGLGPRSAGSSGVETGSTTHVSVIDRQGNAVALTCTIEQEMGSAVIAPRTGFLLNNELTDFGDPGTANAARAGKRPRSSMSPTIVVEDGRPVVVTGGAGGSRIIMGVLFTVLNRVEYGLDLPRAVDAERLDAQAAPEDPILIEGARLARGVLANLKRRGHKFEGEGEYADSPRIQAAGYRGAANGLTKDAVSDSRSENGSVAQRNR
jgi:gamma-glutamyltranspeptidase / glutathione hydrolase